MLMDYLYIFNLTRTAVHRFAGISVHEPAVSTQHCAGGREFIALYLYAGIGARQQVDCTVIAFGDLYIAEGALIFHFQAAATLRNDGVSAVFRENTAVGEVKAAVPHPDRRTALTVGGDHRFRRHREGPAGDHYAVHTVCSHLTGVSDLKISARQLNYASAAVGCV